MTVRKFISPAEACKLAEKILTDTADAQKFLLDYAGIGDIYVRAEKTLEDGKHLVANKRISPDQFRNHGGNIPLSFWNQATWKVDELLFAGISFDRDEVGEAIKKHAGKVGSTPSVKAPLKGGRPALFHGEPIATLTLRYSDRNIRELNRLTAQSLVDELAQEYNKAGGAPSEKNLIATCEGILRALRGRANS